MINIDPKILEVTPTPVLFLSPAAVCRNYERFKYTFPYATIAYSLKANPHMSLLQALVDLGADFDVASANEIGLMKSLGVPGKRLNYSHTIRHPEHIAYAIESGIEWFTSDSVTENQKLAVSGKRLNVLFRVAVENSDAAWPLDKKFGIQNDTLTELVDDAAGRGLEPRGIFFHVGSECTSQDSWIKAIRLVAEHWADLRKKHPMDTLNIGGGFPADKSSLCLKSLAKNVHQAISEYLPGVRHLKLEPGRSVCASAGALLTSVIGLAERSESRMWLYLDAGVYSGMHEARDGIRYPYQCLYSNRREMQNLDTGQVHYQLAGPTCDAYDRLFSISAERPMMVGDRILFQGTGAYIYSVGTHFNGFDPPRVEVLSSEREGRVLQAMAASRA